MLGKLCINWSCLTLMRTPEGIAVLCVWLLVCAAVAGIATYETIGWGSGTSRLPVVDLGYELHRAAELNATGNFYNFSNIRYAAAPSGNLRWRPPQSPATERSKVQDGRKGHICPQASPAWQVTSNTLLHNLITGQPLDINTTTTNSSAPVTAPPQDPRSSEDCLFLDVLVPRPVFDAAKPPGNSSGAPVLFWLYGGGFVTGDKATSPAGLLYRGNESFIYVAPNYRLGAFGFLAGPTLQANGTANAGLLDQRFALEWVQKNIHLFGGDPNRVTLMGESAGGGSVLLQITAYGGKADNVPFNQAILQSPAYFPNTSPDRQEQTFKRFLNILNVSSLAEARELPSSTLMRANMEQVATDSPYGAFTYGPTLDNDLIPALPGQLLLQGNFTSTVNVMAAHNANEGLIFTNPIITNSTAYESAITSIIPTLSADTIRYISQTLYPPVYDGSQGYTNDFERAALTISEMVFTCNTYSLARAYRNRTHNYLFSVPPAVHAWDVPFTFYDGGEAPPSFISSSSSSLSSSSSSPANTVAGSNTTATAPGGQRPATAQQPSSTPGDAKASIAAALALQRFITDFVATGDPGSLPDGKAFPEYGSEAAVAEIGLDGVGITQDVSANARCEWWQRGLY